MHAAVGCSILALNRPTPVHIQFRVTHILRSSCAPGGNLLSGMMVSLVSQVVCCQPDCQELRMLVFVPFNVAAWLEKGQ